MPITKPINSRANLKQSTTGDFPLIPAQIVTNKYGPTASTAAQTVINLGFSVDQANKLNFFLSVDGKLMSEGSLNDYTFTNVQSNNTSSQITLNASIPAGLNLQAWYMGVAQPTVASSSISTVNATLALQPTVQKFLSGSGTYTSPAGVKYLRIRMVGGGGGGGGSGTASGTAATTGGNTSFGTSLLIATGGIAGARDGTEALPSANTVNAPAITVANILGSNPGGSTRQGTSPLSSITGGSGGVSPFGGAGYAGMAGQSGAGGNAAANSGSGGGGAFAPQATGQVSGSGGGSGSYVEAIITSPSANYAYTVGSGGSGQIGGAGGGLAGGAGGSGLIIVEEFYV